MDHIQYQHKPHSSLGSGAQKECSRPQSIIKQSTTEDQKSAFNKRLLSKPTGAQLSKTISCLATYSSSNALRGSASTSTPTVATEKSRNERNCEKILTTTTAAAAAAAAIAATLQ